MQFGVWKIYKCLFIPNCTRKILWLLIIYMKKFTEGLAEETHAYHAIREKLRLPGRALDLKAKDLIGHLWVSLIIDQSECYYPISLVCSIAAVNKRSFVCRLNCDNSHCGLVWPVFQFSLPFSLSPVTLAKRFLSFYEDLSITNIQTSGKRKGGRGRSRPTIKKLLLH